MEDYCITNSFEETQAFGSKFITKLEPGDVVCLYGNLGAGKTTFTQGMAKGLGITKRIISPTFIIVRSYEISNIKFQISNFKWLYHVDLYRLNDENSVEGTGLLEILEKKDSLVIIEWPEKMGSLLPKKRWDVHLENVGGDTRKITINKK